ncbi:restriction endonuclease [Psychrobium sp. MM17-31]|uniref:restriction endonuclease n=1 Tax=Psychrobium sp. MM17-31 TaxID=2917758 RepID=UPI001EF7273A|nr:restriction endonuclease [Psychrobium sp. MM17-31]MCG7532731.1 restriction endonuclease [Psychrobium sp. MM17-31]
MIPSYQDFMRPFLEFAQQGEIQLKDVKQHLIREFSLTDSDLSQLLPSGKQTVFENRVGWARTYLTKTQLLETTKRAHYVITPRGLDAVKDKNAVINVNYLKQFDEFHQFVGQGKDKIEKSVPQQQTDEEITPDEALRAAYERINNALAEDILEKTRKVTPAFFEKLLIELLLAMGYGGTGEGAAHALGMSGDNGVDGVIDQDPLGVDQIYIQAKRYALGNNVGASDIRDFFGALNLKKAQKGIFITTSDFTSSAQQTAQDLGMRIVLINGTELAKLMLRYNIGSRDEQVLHLKKIDEEFFEGC